MLEDALALGRRDEIGDTLEVLRPDMEIDVDALLRLADASEDAFAQGLVRLVAMGRVPPVDRAALAEETVALIQGGFDSGTVLTGTYLRHFVVFLALVPNEAGIDYLCTLVGELPGEVAGAWQQLTHLSNQLRDPWRGQLRAAMVDALLADNERAERLSHQTRTSLDPAEKTRWARQVKRLFRNRPADLITHVILSLGRWEIPDLDGSAWVREALDAVGGHGDGWARFDALLALDASNAILDDVREGLVHGAGRIERLRVSRRLPERYYAEYVERARAWAEDELEHLSTFDLGEGGFPLNFEPIEKWGPSDALEPVLVGLKAHLDRYFRDCTEMKALREIEPALWIRWTNDRESHMRRAIQALVSTIELCRSHIDDDTLAEAIRLVPLFFTKNLAVFLGHLQPPHREALAEEAWAYAQHMAHVDRGTEMSRFVGMLPPSMRDDAIDATLAEAGVFAMGGGGSQDNRWPILTHLAPLFGERHLQTIVEVALGMWRATSGRLAAFVQRLTPEFRRAFIARFAARLSSAPLGADRKFTHTPVGSVKMKGGADDATATQRRLLMPVLVACDDGPSPALVDWSEAATTTQMPSPWVLTRLAERLSFDQLRCYLQSWADDPHGNRIARPLGILVPALLDKARPGDVESFAWIHGLVVEELFRERDGRPGLLRAIAELKGALEALGEAEAVMGVCAAIHEVGQRWP